MNACRTAVSVNGKRVVFERDPVRQPGVGEFLQHEVRIGLERGVLLWAG
jgi:hypothetical protein